MFSTENFTDGDPWYSAQPRGKHEIFYSTARATTGYSPCLTTAELQERHSFFSFFRTMRRKKSSRKSLATKAEWKSSNTSEASSLQHSYRWESAECWTIQCYIPDTFWDGSLLLRFPCQWFLPLEMAKVELLTSQLISVIQEVCQSVLLAT